MTSFGQLPYVVFILGLFLGYGWLVRRGFVAGRAILGLGAFVGAVAVGASFFNIPAGARQTLPLPLLLIAPAMMAVCAGVCVTFAYRVQKVVELASYAIGDTRIVVRYAPLRLVEADALLLPTTTTLRMGGGVPSAVVVAGGALVERAARAQGPVSLGKVVVTPGGRLGVERVFHVAIHEPLRPVDEAGLRRGLENAAQQARKAGAHRVVIPVGALHGLPVSQVAFVSAQALLKQRRAFTEIVFVALVLHNGPPVREAVARALAAVSPQFADGGAPDHPGFIAPSSAQADGRKPRKK